MDDNDWESIHPSTSTSQSDEDDAGAVILTTPTNFNQPPPLEYDHLQEPVHETPSSYSSSTASYATEIVEDEVVPRPPEVTKVTNTVLIKESLGVLGSWVVRVGYGVRSRIGVWSIATVVAVAGVVVYGRWWQRRLQRWRRVDEIDKLMGLLNQKDEKIKQLLLQIDRMNETISARRRVPVLRVVVDSPLVIGPRFSRMPT